MSIKFVDLYPDEEQARLDELEEAADRAAALARDRADKRDRAAKNRGRRPTEQSASRTMDEDEPAADADHSEDAWATDPDWSAAAAAYDEYAAEVEPLRIRVALRHRPRKEWRALMEQHKARDDVDGDKMFGVNMDTLPDVLVPASIDPELSENLPADVPGWLDGLSDLDYYDRLFVSAFAANRGKAVADPTQRLLSAGSRTSSATSSSPSEPASR